MVSTIKFSQMTDGGDIANNDQVPGLLSGGNVLFNNPWTFLPPGSTADRPAPSAAINYRLRFNTDDQLYEYYDAVLGQWTQLQESLFTTGPFVTYTASVNLPDAFNLGGLTSGILKQTVSTGVSTPAIAINGTDYYGPGFTGFFQAPAGVQDINSLNVLTFATIGNTATDWLVLSNGMFMQPPFVGVDGAATDIQLNLFSKGAGEIAFNTLASTNAMSFFTGTAYQHQTLFSFANTSNIVTVTWPDSSGTVAYVGAAAETFIGDSGTASPSSGNISFTGGSTGLTFTGATSVMTLGGVLGGTNGGTGVNNGASLLGYEGNINFIGAYSLQVTLTGATSIQFPTGGILLNSNLTSADFYVGNGSNIATGVAMSGDASLANTGAVTVSSVGGKAVTLGGTFTTSGAFNTTFTMTGNTNVTFPTSGTLATTSSASGIVNSGSINQLAWYAANGTTVSGLSTANSGVLITSAGGVPSISTTLPNGLAMGTPASITLTNGTGLPISGITGLGTGVATALAAAVSGSGGIALTTSPTFTTPILGAASATSLTFSSTSGIIGTTTNNNAAAGSVGEFVTSNVAVTNTSLSSGTIADTTSISLTAGDWDVFGAVGFFGGSTTTPTFFKGWINTTSASDPGAPNYASSFPTGTPFATAPYDFTVPSLRVSVASTTTVYLSVQAVFAVSTCTAGGVISARRRR
jgi:hypothetical protein